MGNDTAQAHFITAYANSRFPLAVAKKPLPEPAQPRSATSTSSHAHGAGQKRPQTKSTAPAAPATASRINTGALPSVPSNAKLQLVQAPAIDVALPATSRPSTSAFTLDHASSEAAAAAAQKKLRLLEQRLRAARGEGRERACFCQGKGTDILSCFLGVMERADVLSLLALEHPVSPVIPLCPRCLLVLCDINVPYSRACPSCSYRPLVQDAVLAEKIVQLEAEHESVDSKEKERLRMESEEEQRARQAIQFPELHEGRALSPSGSPGGSIDYAGKAGSGSDHYHQVKQAYRNAQAREEAIAASGERRVLTLNSKTKKVQYQTVKPNKSKSVATSADAIHKQKKAAKTADLDDDRKPYIDENDDALLGKPQTAGKLSTSSWPPLRGSGVSYVKTKGTASVSYVESDGSDGPDDDSAWVETDDYVAEQHKAV